MRGGGADEQVGPYRLVRRLGRGGMGEVWLAEHVQIKSQVAVKLVLSDEAEDAARFLREARAAASIRHPGIVAVTDFGERHGGGAYLVMELLEGESLDQRLKRERLALPTVLEVAIQLVEALAAAHAAGVVHRDLKPSNVFLATDAAVPGGVRVKLLDFGVARPLPTEDVKLTTTDALIGTPLYMAPEQCSSRFGAIDHRADLYALGVVLYELVTGAPPFSGPSLGDLLDQHLNVPPVPPLTHVPDLPPSLDGLILSLLVKRPELRSSSAAEVAHELRALRGEALPRVAPSPVVLEATLRSAPRRARLPLWARVLAAAVVVTGVLAATVPRVLEPRDLSAEPAAALEASCDSGRGPECFELAQRELRREGPFDLQRVVARLTSACDAGVAGACAWVAWSAIDGVAVRADAVKGRELAERACASGSGYGCDLAGEAWAHAAGGPADVMVALSRWLRGCELGYAGSCQSVGSRFRLKGDPATAALFAHRAYGLARDGCEKNDAASCRIAGLLQVRGAGTAPEPARGALALQRACELGAPEACADIGQLAALGIGVTRDPVRAGTLLRRACERGSASGCVALAVAMANGLIGPRDPDGAHALARSLCEDRSERLCSLLGSFYLIGTGTPQDRKLAMVHFERACRAGDAEACAQAADINIPGVPKDEPKVIELQQRACSLGSAIGCRRIGQRAVKKGDGAAAMAAFEVACRVSDFEVGCVDLAALHFDGLGTPVDPVRGRALLVDACGRNAQESCHALGLRLRDGKGLEARPAEALPLFQKSCDLGWGKGCLAASAMLSDADGGLTVNLELAAKLKERGCSVEPWLCMARDGGTADGGAPDAGKPLAGPGPR